MEGIEEIETTRVMRKAEILVVESQNGNIAQTQIDLGIESIHPTAAKDILLKMTPIKDMDMMALSIRKNHIG